MNVKRVLLFLGSAVAITGLPLAGAAPIARATRRSAAGLFAALVVVGLLFAISSRTRLFGLAFLFSTVLNALVIVVTISQIGS